MPETLRQLWTGLRTLLVLTVLLGIAYPVVVWGVGAVFDSQRNGSLIFVDGQPRGSALIGQQFDGPGWFQPRPSAGDYDAQASGGSNLGPNSPDLVASVEKTRQTIAKRDGVAPDQVPPDAVTSSGSGLDPFISPAYADIQIARVARERGLSLDAVRAAVAAHTEGRMLGFLGEPRVNVVELNLELSSR